MSTPAAPPPGQPMPGASTPFDTGNALLAPGPAQLICAHVQIPGGPQMLATTIRTPSVTVTAFLAKQDVEAWRDRLAAEAANMSGSGLTVANGALPKLPMPGNGQLPPGLLPPR
jgi:hypothetical protein